VREHKIVLIFCGVMLIISTFFPWADLENTNYYIHIYELNIVSGLIIFTIGLSAIFIGIDHKPKPGKIYSRVIIFLGSIGYFTISNLTKKIAQFKPSAIGIGILLSGTCIVVLEICGWIPAPKDMIKIKNKVNWRSITMVFLGIGLLIMTLFCIYKVIDGLQLVQIDNNSKSTKNTSVITRNTVTPTKTIRQITRTFTPQKPNCTHWSEITLNDVGKTICVYGTVYDSYWGGDIFYIRFTTVKNSFKFIVLNNYYFEDINGKCVQSTSEIKNFDKVPYMEVREKIYFCDY